MDNDMDLHSLQNFDDALAQLHQHLITMGRQTSEQFDSILSALDQGDADFATQAIQQDNRLDRLELIIDAEIITLLARHQPVASDLRVVLSTSKISTELERIGDELVKIGGLIIELYTANVSKQGRNLFDKVYQASKLSSALLKQTVVCLETANPLEARCLAEKEEYLAIVFNDSLSQQFSLLIQDIRLISPTLKILQIIDGLIHINAHCISIAEYLLLMVGGSDIRHQKNA